jgi:predicted transcriptional regulator
LKFAPFKYRREGLNREVFEDGRRGFFEIVADILHVCNGMVGKTFLMYRCNMNFSQLSGYLKLILDAHLVEIRDEEPRILFKISRKGKHFLKAYENLKALMR